MKTRSHIALILSVLMVLSILTGCGAKEPEASSITPTVEATDPVQEEKDVSLGRMEGGIYTNPYAGYGCSLDSSWVFYTAEELQELPENVQELFAESELGEATSDLTQITDMMADNSDIMASINVLYTKLSLQERLAYATMNHEQVIDATLASKDSIIDAYEKAGITNVTMEKIFVTFLGEQRAAVKTSATIGDMAQYILQIQDYSLGAYGVTLTISTFFEDNTESLLDLFYTVE